MLRRIGPDQLDGEPDWLRDLVQRYSPDPARYQFPSDTELAEEAAA